MCRKNEKKKFDTSWKTFYSFSFIRLYDCETSAYYNSKFHSLLLNIQCQFPFLKVLTPIHDDNRYESYFLLKYFSRWLHYQLKGMCPISNQFKLSTSWNKEVGFLNSIKCPGYGVSNLRDQSIWSGVEVLEDRRARQIETLLLVTQGFSTLNTQQSRQQESESLGGLLRL